MRDFRSELRAAWERGPVILCGPAGRGKSHFLRSLAGRGPAGEETIYVDCERHTLTAPGFAAASWVIPELAPGMPPALLEADALAALPLTEACRDSAEQAWNQEEGYAAFERLRARAGGAPLLLDDALALGRLERWRAGRSSPSPEAVSWSWLGAAPVVLATRYPGRLAQWLGERGVPATVLDLPPLDSAEAAEVWRTATGDASVRGASSARQMPLPKSFAGEPGWILHAAGERRSVLAEISDIEEFSRLPPGFQERIERSLDAALAEARGEANLRAILVLLAVRPRTLTQLAAALRVKVGTMQDYLGSLDAVRLIERMGRGGMLYQIGHHDDAGGDRFVAQLIALRYLEPPSPFRAVAVEARRERTVDDSQLFFD